MGRGGGILIVHSPPLQTKRGGGEIFLVHSPPLHTRTGGGGILIVHSPPFQTKREGGGNPCPFSPSFQTRMGRGYPYCPFSPSSDKEGEGGYNVLTSSRTETGMYLWMRKLSLSESKWQLKVVLEYLTLLGQPLRILASPPPHPLPSHPPSDFSLERQHWRKHFEVLSQDVKTSADYSTDRCVLGSSHPAEEKQPAAWARSEIN